MQPICTRHVPILLLLAALAVPMTGCVQGEVTYWLNPDGSGKVVLDIVMPAMEGLVTPGKPGGKTQMPAAQLERLRKKFAGDLIEDSKGITAWENVSAEFQKDGKIRFRGTAYFKDIAKLKIKTIPLPSPKLRKQQGKLRLVLEDDDDDKKHRKDSKDRGDDDIDPSKLSDKQLEKYVLLQRVKFQQSKGILQAMLHNLDIKAVFRLPGDVTTVEGFNRRGPKVVSMRLQGKEILNEFQRITMLPDDKLRAYLKKHKSILPPRNGSPQAMKEISPLFARFGNASAVVGGPTDRLFDFSAAVEKAKKADSEIRNRFDVDEDRGAAGGRPDLPPGVNDRPVSPGQKSIRTRQARKHEGAIDRLFPITVSIAASGNLRQRRSTRGAPLQRHRTFALAWLTRGA